MNSAHGFLPFLSLPFNVSLSLSMFISHPLPSLKPIYSFSSMNSPLGLSSFFNLLYNMVSRILYTGEVLVIGRELSKFLYMLLSLGMNIYSSNPWSCGHSSYLITSLRYLVIISARCVLASVSLFYLILFFTLSLKYIS